MDVRVERAQARVSEVVRLPAVAEGEIENVELGLQRAMTTERDLLRLKSLRREEAGGERREREGRDVIDLHGGAGERHAAQRARGERPREDRIECRHEDGGHRGALWSRSSRDE